MPKVRIGSQAQQTTLIPKKSLSIEIKVCACVKYGVRFLLSKDITDFHPEVRMAVAHMCFTHLQKKLRIKSQG